MAKHSRHRRGCDCLNSMDEIGETANPGLCDACNDPYRRALCAYVALFECSYYTQDARREKVTEPCVVLRKDCIIGCTYSSRWCCSTSDPSTDTQYLQKSDCGTVVSSSPGSCSVCPVQCYSALITAATLPNACPLTALALSDAIAGGGLRINMPEITPCRWFGRRCPFGCYPGSDYINLNLTTDIDGNFTFTIQYPTGECTFGSSPLYYAEYSFPLDPFNCFNPGELVLTDGDFTITITLTNGRCLPDGQDEITNMEDCTWAQDPCSCTDACANGPEETGLYDEYADSNDTCYTKWRLDISSAPVATLTGITRNGETITYRTTAFECYESTTFTLVAGDYDPVFIGLPRCLCVRPIDYRPDGGCADSGLEACCDSGGPSLNVKLTLIDCNGDTVLDEEWVSFARGAALPCGVPNPFPDDPCLYFATQVTVEADCAEWGGDLFIVMYCSQTPDAPGVSSPCGYPDSESRYNFVWYCYDQVAECWEERGSACSSYTCSCLGPNPPALTITKDCCCLTCGGCSVPESLFASDGTTSVELVWDGVSSWGPTTAPGGFGGCNPEGNVSVIVTCLGAGEDPDTFSASLLLDASDSGTDDSACSPISLSFISVCDGNPITVTE